MNLQELVDDLTRIIGSHPTYKDQQIYHISLRPDGMVMISLETDTVYVRLIK